MTREEAIKILQHKIEIMNDGAICCNYGIDKNVFEMAIKALEQEPCADAVSRQAVLDVWHTSYSNNREENEEMQYKKIAFELSPVRPQEPKWIPVSERLPENHNQEVLISLEWGIDIGRYDDGEWHSEWINHYDDGNVLAWMPLPKPYKIESENKNGQIGSD